MGRGGVGGLAGGWGSVMRRAVMMKMLMRVEL